MLTMLLGGLWHGASWTFVFWGFLHGAGLVVTRLWQRSGPRFGRVEHPYREAREGARARPTTSEDHPVYKAIRVVLTFHYVCLAWIFFRAKTFADAWQILRQLAQRTTFHPNLPPLVLALLATALGSHYVPERAYEELRSRFTALPAPAQGAVLFLVAVVLHEAASTTAVPFVYFQF
jgi:D-alanyl-lipoteichoic acid acyltransferase DltB (MBOAT superfamily)